ncbi:DUF3408 domain-containing protein [uncultured Bacteroides sp.]|uniref:DUF3408 domain-containing protein n=1 Tax=uncultured Bacteroides sp. TaxID=162156 RepID=UPI00260AABDF|nr:DUF3408 domain-containing protein [uncultured Bacteroides sp.]
MSKKQTLSKTELQEMTGLDFSEQNSQIEESRKKGIDAALEDFSIENIKPLPLPSVAEQAQTEVVPSVAEVATEISPIVNAEQQPPTPPIQRRVSSKQRKLSLEEYRNTFMRPYKIEDRKPVFISGKLRKMLDKFACKIGEDRMSMSGLLENIVRHHIELYSEDFEHWKGM